MQPRGTVRSEQQAAHRAAQSHSRTVDAVVHRSHTFFSCAPCHVPEPQRAYTKTTGCTGTQSRALEQRVPATTKDTPANGQTARHLWPAQAHAALTVDRIGGVARTLPFQGVASCRTHVTTSKGQLRVMADGHALTRWPWRKPLASSTPAIGCVRATYGTHMSVVTPTTRMYLQA